jgi:hypothetical protein
MQEGLYKAVSILLFGKPPAPKPNLVFMDFTAIEERLLRHYQLKYKRGATVAECEATARGIMARWHKKLVQSSEANCPGMPSINQIKMALLIGERSGLVKIL